MTARPGAALCAAAAFGCDVAVTALTPACGVVHRWERAAKLGLEPPVEVKAILEAAAADSPLHLNIWSGRV
jgi:hypothetical protein